MKSKLTIDKDGTKEWTLPDGLKHREDGPAVEWFEGTKSWYINGQRHREDGPAIEYGNGINKWWYLNGIEYTEKEYKIEIRSIKLKKLLL